MRFQRDSGRGGGERAVTLPMTSMIDVVFLLLVYFLVTASMTPSEAQLSSALQSDEKAAGSLADLQPQVIRVEMVDGEVGFVIGSRLMRSRDDLLALLEQLPKEGGVFIRVANDVPVSAPAAAIQAAKDAGFRKVSYVPAGMR